MPVDRERRSRCRSLEDVDKLLEALRIRCFGRYDDAVLS